MRSTRAIKRLRSLADRSLGTGIRVGPKLVGILDVRFHVIFGPVEEAEHVVGMRDMGEDVRRLVCTSLFASERRVS